MKIKPAFTINNPAYSIRQLSLENLGSIQVLFEKCLDYMLLVDGHPASPEGVEKDFLSTPPGKSLDDKYVFGIETKEKELVGLLDAMRGYPDATTWWIGLLIFLPEARSQGLGGAVLRGFEDFVQTSGGQAIMLGVVEENERAYRFWERGGFKLVLQTEPQKFGNKTQKVNIMRRAL